jgi:glycosyltransferase involved in cell wall biosynthesis
MDDRGTLPLAGRIRGWFRRAGVPGIRDAGDRVGEEPSRSRGATGGALLADSSGTDICLGRVLRGEFASIDHLPWRHPFLTTANLAAFRDYSERVWQLAADFSERHPSQLRCAFFANMAQNMYKWARLSQEFGVSASLFANPMDTTAISNPRWEHYDGQWDRVLDGAGFLEAHRDIGIDVPFHDVPIRAGEGGLATAYRAFCTGDRAPLLRLLASAAGVRHEVLLAYSGFHTYWDLARELSRYDVIYAASVPFAAYFSGRPYCALSVGGDLIWDCGRPDDWGRALTLAFNAARFLMITNPQTLAHSRRLGFANGVYLPYPIDDHRYAPGPGNARREWEERCGPGVYVLTTSRLDEDVKGYGGEFVAVLRRLVDVRPELRFVFIAWGADADRIRQETRAAELGGHVLFLSPAGKQRLIDYYRSADVVLDHLVYGYYGATTLEAAAIGKPIVMRQRTEHYAPLYRGDVAPVAAVEGLQDVADALVMYAQDPARRRESGEAMRAWLVRNHGRERTMPILLALLRVAAARQPLDTDGGGPLSRPLDESERAYHEHCLVAMEPQP